MDNSEMYKDALALFIKQMECLKTENRKEQMKLYSNDLRYEFPFADDRPRTIIGKDNFYKVMKPLWEKAQLKGLKVIGYDYEFHSTDTEGLFLAVFSLDVKEGNDKISIPFIQIIEIENRKIASVKEYNIINHSD